MDELLKKLADGTWPPDAMTLQIVAGVSIAFGLLNCFLGYRIFRALLAVWGFVIGAAVAGAVGMRLRGPVVGVAAGLGGGVVGAVAMVLFYYVAVFLIGAGLGAGIVHVARGGGTQITPTTGGIMIAVGVPLGILALFLQRYILIVSTSLAGAAAAVGGAMSLYYLEKGIDPRAAIPQTRDPAVLLEQHLTPILAALALAAAGIVVQLLWTGKKKQKPQPPPAPATPPPAPPPIQKT